MIYKVKKLRIWFLKDKIQVQTKKSQPHNKLYRQFKKKLIL